jgi:hypothetical protein
MTFSFPAMNRSQTRAVLLVALLVLSACAGLKDALTAHVDVVARAGSQELSVSQLAKLMSDAQVPARKDVATAIANLWVNYQLVAIGGAKGDTAVDAATVADKPDTRVSNGADAVFKSTPTLFTQSSTTVVSVLAKPF